MKIVFVYSEGGWALFSNGRNSLQFDACLGKRNRGTLRSGAPSMVRDCRNVVGGWGGGWVKKKAEHASHGD